MDSGIAGQTIVAVRPVGVGEADILGVQLRKGVTAVLFELEDGSVIVPTSDWDAVETGGAVVITTDGSLDADAALREAAHRAPRKAK